MDTHAKGRAMIELASLPRGTTGCVDPEHFDRAIGLTLDAIEQLRAQQADAAHIEAAVAAGIRRAVADPEMWEAASHAMRAQAQTAAGGWLLGGVRSLATRAAWVVAILAAVYALGGWGAVVALIKTHGGPH